MIATSLVCAALASPSWFGQGSEVLWSPRPQSTLRPSIGITSSTPCLAWADSGSASLPLNWDIARLESCPQAAESIVPNDLENRITNPWRRIDIPGRTCVVDQLRIDLELSLEEAKSQLVDLREGGLEVNPNPFVEQGHLWRFVDSLGNYYLIVKDEEAPQFKGSDYYMSARTRTCVKELASQVFRATNGKVIIRITEAYSDRKDGDKPHERGSLHYQGQAVDVTAVAVRSRALVPSELGRIGYFAWRSGCDFVWFEDASHLHVGIQELGAKWHVPGERVRRFSYSSDVFATPGVDEGSMDIVITSPEEHLPAELRGALNDLLLLIGLPTDTHVELITRLDLQKFSPARGGTLYLNDSLFGGSSGSLNVKLPDGSEWELAIGSDEYSGGVHLKLSTNALGNTVYDGCYRFRLSPLFGASFEFSIEGAFRFVDE